MKTKTFEVELRMFQKGAIRKVRVPVRELEAAGPHILSMVWKYGQNDFQPQKNRVSVSVGDVIRYGGSRYLILGLGFRKLRHNECTKKLTMPEEIVTEAVRLLSERGNL